MKAKRYFYLNGYLAMCLLMSCVMAQEGGQEGWWMKEPIRWVQTNLRQTDAGLDARRLAEQLADMRANVVLMGMGGIAAYYPTGVEFHYPSPDLPAGRDMFGDVRMLCEDTGLMNRPARLMWRVCRINGRPSRYRSEPQREHLPVPAA